MSYCNKKAFSSKSEAEIRLLEIRIGEGDPDKTGEVRRVYYCKYCKQYHLTSKTKKEYIRNVEIREDNKRRAIVNIAKSFAKRKGWDLDLD